MLTVRIHLGTAKEAISRNQDVLFNDALNTFYLRLYGIIHMVKDHSDRERERERKPAAATWATHSD